AASNWMLGPVKSWLNDKGLSIAAFPLPPQGLAGLIELVESGTVGFSAASSSVFPELLLHPEKTAAAVAKEKNLVPDSDEQRIAARVDQVLKTMPGKGSEYRKGKKGLIGLCVGEVKKVSGGKADPRRTNAILLEKLKS